ncbi:UNVERIFIED_CONTAM: polyprotein [Sesamum latifolium]|uniref:Polyprotein n=1 Tax=Sesamum latifolium TaxID=2727402 RepID=A0AAW2WRJ4_9LAMI
MDTTRTDNPIGNVDQFLHIASTLSLPRITSSSVDNLVEYSTIPEAAIVENTVPPIISPYNLYRKRGSFPQGIRALIASKKRMNEKEQVHSSKMDHCSLLASTKEHQDCLLDTRFLEYEHAVIGTVLTTLNAGSIVVTFFPNFAVSLCDPHVASAFKVQVQITGANQVPASVIATLHHQLVFGLQNHSLDLPNQGRRDAPMQHETIRATDFRFKRLPDGRVKTILETQPAREPSNPGFQLMITPIPVQEEIITPISSFGADGYHIYADWINGHFIWDVDPSMCDPECSCGEESDDDDNDYIWSDYESDQDDNFSSWKLKPLTQAEEVLNWQTTNARAQNRSLTTLDAKMD